MKHFLLLVIVIITGTACKKDKKDPPPGPYTIIGKWHFQGPTTGGDPYTSTFRIDRSYIWNVGFVGVIHGTYKLNATDSAMIYEMILTNNGMSDTSLMKIVSHNEIFISNKAGTHGWPWKRVK